MPLAGSFKCSASNGAARVSFISASASDNGPTGGGINSPAKKSYRFSNAASMYSAPFRRDASPVLATVLRSNGVRASVVNSISRCVAFGLSCEINSRRRNACIITISVWLTSITCEI